MVNTAHNDLLIHCTMIVIVLALLDACNASYEVI
jgi:hypothetical protein